MKNNEENKEAKKDELIRVTTAAKLKGVRRQAIYYHIEQKRLRTKVIDENIYVYRDEVEALEILKPTSGNSNIMNAKKKTMFTEAVR